MKKTKSKSTKTNFANNLARLLSNRKTQLLIFVILFAVIGGSIIYYSMAAGPQTILMAGRAGFGANTTGGKGGTIYHVTNNADSGPGSLRTGLTGNTAQWVVFDGNYTIKLSSGILVGSNKTIDGRGRRVIITAPKKDGLLIHNVQNVIVEDLIFYNFGDVTQTIVNNPYDAISIDQAKNVWVDHNTLSMAGDKLISVERSQGVTVSWNHFVNQEQVFQIGNLLYKTDDLNQTVTIHHNFFDKTAYRHPVLTYGKAHSYNNYIYGWTVYGAASVHLGQLYSQNNIYEALAEKRATIYRDAQNCNDAKTICDYNLGYIKSVGDLPQNGAKILQNSPELVFDPATYYKVNVEPADATLKQEVKTKAGWQQTGVYYPPVN